MITQISLTNFKCFKEETKFPLSKLNLLTGINGRGKSTLLQSLLLMRQSVEHNEYTSQIILNGSCVRLGTFQDVKNQDNADDKNIIFDFIISNESEVSVSFFLTAFKHNETLANICELSIKSKDKIISYNDEKETDEIVFKKFSYVLSKQFYNSIFLKQFDETYVPLYFNYFDSVHYVSADRLGPQDFYIHSNIGKFLHVGVKGEFVANVLSLAGKNKVDEKLHLFADKNFDKTIETQIGAWISKILDTDNVKVLVDEKIKGNVYVLSFRFGNKSYKPSNVGFGFTYILPIIVSGLIAQPDEILIVENPEAHLHPKAQHELTKFLATVASTGVQVFIESHSEHILNGVRISTLDKNIGLENEDVSILYFQNDDNEPFVKIPIVKKGRIENWPEGFFDQTEKDFNVLIGF